MLKRKSSLKKLYFHTKKNSSVNFIELFKSWGYGTEFWKMYRTFQNKKRNIQEKRLKVPHFIPKIFVNFPELCSANICIPNS